VKKMSVVTSVIVSVHAFSPDAEETIIREIQGYVRGRGHFSFYEHEHGGGEKALTCTLLIGSFNFFETDDFTDFIKKAPWFDPSGEANQIEVIIKEVDREDFAKWKVIL
jgi:hypothetical protein